MKKIFVRKTLRYDPTCEGKYSRYTGYSKITSGREDPQILKGQKPISDNDVLNIFCSPARRAIESTNYCGAVVEELREVKFELDKLVTENEFNNCGSVLVRQRFLEMFVKDDLKEKRMQIKRRLDSLINKINKLPNGRYLLISHSFIMKILETYLNENELFEHTEILFGYLNPQKRTYNFGEGFEFEI